ncbi:MAG: hypothetical protein M1540_05590 [Candidatus Bathyarchaeota archaeon]|nr:hypothetical protein [Candidatus Bathyarchaeota archaeon]
MEYNLAIGLFTSFLTTGFTVIFLNIFLSYRKQKQWKAVKDNAYFEITTEIAAIFSVTIELIEGQFAAGSFKLTVGTTKDANVRKTLILSKIKEYEETKPLKLAVNTLDSVTNKIFHEARANLYSIHVIYGNLIDDARVINGIIKVRYSLRVLELMQATVESFNKEVKQNPLIETAQKLFPALQQIDINNLGNNLTEAALAPTIQKLVENIKELWELKIQFDRV